MMACRGEDGPGLWTKSTSAGESIYPATGQRRVLLALLAKANSFWWALLGMEKKPFAREVDAYQVPEDV